MLDDYPIEDVARWLSCWPPEVAAAFRTVLHPEKRLQVHCYRPGSKYACACGRTFAYFSLLTHHVQDSGHEPAGPAAPRVPERCEELQQRMASRYAWCSSLSLDQMMKRWAAWYAAVLSERCLQNLPPQKDPWSRPDLRRLAPPLGWSAALGLGWALGWGWAPQSAADVLRPLGVTVVSGARGSVAVAPPQAKEETLRGFLGDDVRVFPSQAPPARSWWPLALVPWGLLAWSCYRRPAPHPQIPPPPPPQPPDEPVTEPPVRVEIGHGLLPLTDPNQGALLLRSLARLRQELNDRLGVVLPAVRCRDNPQLASNEYRLLLREAQIGRGTVVHNKVLAVFPHTSVWIAPLQSDGMRRMGARIETIPQVIDRTLESWLFANAGELEAETPAEANVVV